MHSKKRKNESWKSKRPNDNGLKFSKSCTLGYSHCFIVQPDGGNEDNHLSIVNKTLLKKSYSFLIVSLSKGLSLCFMCSDQQVKYQMPCGFPLTNSLLLDYHVKQYKHTQIHRRTDTQTHGHTDTQTHRHTDTRAHIHTHTLHCTFLAESNITQTLQ